MPGFFDKLFHSFDQRTPIPPGFLSYHTKPEDPLQYRLHLRVEPDGDGVLILNASSILHLNQTATEIAYYMMKGQTVDEITALISDRFSVKPELAKKDVQDFLAQIDSFIHAVDQNPNADFGFEKHLDTSGISAPYRLDCCLTYRLEAAEQGMDPHRSEDPLKTDEWKKIIKKAYDAAIPHLVFYGGEPSLRDDLSELLSYCEELGLVSGLVSSGRKLLEPAYVEGLIASGLDHLMIPWVLHDTQMRQALDEILPMDLYTCINLPIQKDFDFIPLINELKGLGANAFSLAPVSEDDYEYFLELCDYVEALDGVDLVQDMPLPVPAETFDRQEDAQELNVDDSALTIMKVDADGRLHMGFPPYSLIGSMLADTWPKLWERCKRNASL